MALGTGVGARSVQRWRKIAEEFRGGADTDVRAEPSIRGMAAPRRLRGRWSDHALGRVWIPCRASAGERRARLAARALPRVLVARGRGQLRLRLHRPGWHRRGGRRGRLDLYAVPHPRTVADSASDTGTAAASPSPAESAADTTAASPSSGAGPATGQRGARASAAGTATGAAPAAASAARSPGAGAPCAGPSFAAVTLAAGPVGTAVPAAASAVRLQGRTTAETEAGPVHGVGDAAAHAARGVRRGGPPPPLLPLTKRELPCRNGLS